MIEVLKRDKKTRECFQKHKIHHAIESAYLSVGKKMDEDAFNCVMSQFPEDTSDGYLLINVEDIQDRIEKCLFDYDTEVAISFHDYRLTHKLIRSERKGLAREFAKKLMCENIENQNANVDEYSFGGRMAEASNVYKKDFALNNCVSKQTKRNHLNNESYIHDLDNYASGEHNCFERSTKFITSKGIMSFNNFEDGEKIEVLTMNGEWSVATVHKYGRGKVNDITLERCGKKVTIGATSNHRWILKNGDVTTTLHIGDELYPLQEMKDEISIDTEEDAYWWCFGFVIGDGCDHYNKTQCRLCGKKIIYEPIFEKAKYKKNGKDTFVKCLYVGKQEFLDNCMWKFLSKKQKQMIFNGYMSADGENGFKNCSTSDKRIVSLLSDISSIAGYHIHSIRMAIRDTQYKENALLYHIRFTRSHRNQNLWKVVSITPRNHCNDTLWCVEEPKTHSFTLDGGIVTGNCLSLPLDDLLANGSKVGQTDIRPAGSINSAMQLTAVYFQIQSQEQFGGVSATHYDWTMVPYVRKSFFKHYVLNYIKDQDDFDSFSVLAKTNDDIDDWVEEHKKEFLMKFNLKFEDFRFDNLTSLDTHYANSALFDTKIELMQAVEALYHNLNTLQSRPGSQLPFSSMNYGSCTLPEGQMVIEALLDGSLRGTGKHHLTPIFPCGIFQVGRGINKKPGDPNYYLFRKALKSTAKRIYPNFANLDWSGNKGYDKNDPRTYFSTMGKRNTTAHLKPFEPCLMGVAV